MSIRNLDYLFKPKSVALIGASTRPLSVGSVIGRNLLRSRFGGPVMPVNPKHSDVGGVIAYPDVASLPVVPDLAVICTPPDTVPGIITDLGRRGTKAAVVITAGFGGDDPADERTRKQAILDAAKPHLMRIIGPNCLGILVPTIGLDASFSPAAPAPGKLAFVAQSGAIVTSIVDWADERGIGFSHLVSLGDMIDVDFGDMLDYLANDRKTSAILLYVEAITNARKFMSAARAAARMKPVIVVKAGRHAEGARAAASHTGALAGADDVYDAVFRRAGMLRVLTLSELFDAAEILSLAAKPRDDRLAIVSNGGGIAVLATDALIEEGGRLAELDPGTLERLDGVLPQTWPRANPIDMIGDAPGQRYADTLRIVLTDPNVDAVLVLNSPTAVAPGLDAAQAVIEAVAGHDGKLILTSWVGGTLANDARALFAKHGLSTHETPEQGVRAFMNLIRYQRAQENLMETPASRPTAFAPDRDSVRNMIDRVLAEDRSWLTEPEAKDVLAAYDIPAGRTELAVSVDDAVAAARRIGFPVAVKILSPDITHKSDVGGVALDLEDDAAVRKAGAVMLDTVEARRPEARIEGFTVQAMISRPQSFELIIGAHEDAQFGPVILFGHGGTAVEVIGDRSLGLPPLNMQLAHSLMQDTRVFKLLQGYRDVPAAHLDAIALTLIKVSQLVTDFAEIAEIDINPLLADNAGVMALDARIRVTHAAASAVDRLAVRPYPKELEGTVALRDGRTLLVRPIVPEDEPALREAFAMLTQEQVRQRFFIPMKTLTHMAAARFTQLDYDREMALVLTEPGSPGKAPIFGVVRISTDPDKDKAEYAIVIRPDVTGMGLGTHLMQRIIEYARSQGIGQIFGDVLRENATMLAICDRLGFERSVVEDDGGIVRVTLPLGFAQG